jgi:signal transduction histidine kinase
MELPDQIAAIVHDVKNRLQLLSPDISCLLENDSTEVQEAGKSIGSTLDEINHQLVLLLGIYRLDEAELFAQEECFVSDLLGSLVERVHDCECNVTCDEDLTAFCDPRLISAVLGDAVHNAVRHSEKKIQLSAEQQGKGILIKIEDDGKGLADQPQLGVGLGLILAAKIAAAHRNGDQHGRASLRNSSLLGGGCFELFLP